MKLECEIRKRLDYIYEHIDDDDADFRALELEQYVLEWVLGEAK